MSQKRFVSFFLACVFFISVDSFSQSTPAHAFKNVIIHSADGSVTDNGTIVWRDGIIEAIGIDTEIPFDAFKFDGGDSLHIYPGFLDGLALWGSPDLPKEFERPERPGDPGYERAGIQPQRHPGELLNKNDKNFKQAQKHGFTTLGLGLKGYMLPGQIDLFFLAGNHTGKYLLDTGHAILMQFEDAPRRVYPSTQMGIMAEFRQLWYDARALRDHLHYFANTSENYPAPDRNEVLESLFPVMDRDKPIFFVADEKGEIEKAMQLSSELGFTMTIVSGKEAYNVANKLANSEISVLASLDLPDKPEWYNEDDSEKEGDLTAEQEHYRERQLEAYIQQVKGIRTLMDAGVTVGFASNGIKLEDIPKNMGKIMEDGDLTSSQLVMMLTQNTAEILGISNRIGDLREGYIANFSVYTKPFTEEKSQVKYSVSNGKLTEFKVTTGSNRKNKE